MIYLKAPLLAAFVSQVLPCLGAVKLEHLSALPQGWQAVAIPADDQNISLSIGLVLQNIDQLESKLMSVSTPGSPEYGQHLDADQVNALFAPSQEAKTAVQSWLTEAGVSDFQLSSDGHWIHFATTVAKANDLLATKFRLYHNSGVNKLRTTQYSVPESVASYIDLISPTTYFGKSTSMNAIPINKPRNPPAATLTTRQTASGVTLDKSCTTSISPSCLKQLYNVGNYSADASSGSKVAFGSFLNQSAIYSDLAVYEKYFNIPSQNFTTILIDGGVDDQNQATAQSGEANLDAQTLVGVAHPLPVIQYITGGSPPFIPDLATPTDNNEPYLPYYQWLLSQPNSAIPQVISNSYGDDEVTVPKAYAVRVCNMIGMMGLRGISILESSGDTGVGSACLSNDGKNKTIFNSVFPATCPYVTSIGGTQAVSPEVAWHDGSGGFSIYFPRALFQEKALDTYFDKYISNSTVNYYTPYTDFTGRGFPDISAHSLSPNFKIFQNGVSTESGGTSAASPTVAAIIALLNDARLRAGKPVLGWLNPLLYYNATSSLNDITGGSAVGCNGVNGQTGETIPGGGIVPYASWNATVGWDPVTGLGTPNFMKLKDLVLSF